MKGKMKGAKKAKKAKGEGIETEGGKKWGKERWGGAKGGALSRLLFPAWRAFSSQAPPAGR
jgi:hypothetical protein